MVPGSHQRSVNEKSRGPARLPGGPERTCLGCGARFAKGELLRFVVLNGGLLADQAQQLPGRGVYCCRLAVCLKKFASKKGRLTRSLRAEVTDCQAVAGIIAQSCGG